MINRNLVMGLLVITLVLVAIPVGVSAQEQSQRINTIEIDENGDAIWTIEIREPLPNSSDVKDFESYVQQVNSSTNNQTRESFRTQFQTVISGANESYERNMSLDSLTVEAEVVNTATGTYGVTTVQFTWLNYAQVNSDGSIQIGQILSDGYTLSETEKLTIVPPKDYEISTMPNGATVTEHGAIEWTGPYAFSNLDATLIQSGSQNFPIDPVIGIGVVAVVIVAVAGGVLYSRRSNGDSNWSASDLQTEEEKIVELVENNDGRIKQKMVADEFGWSDAKVSRVTSSLEEDGVLEKLMIGRENVLDLNEEDREDS